MVYEVIKNCEDYQIVEVLNSLMEARILSVKAFRSYMWFQITETIGSILFFLGMLIFYVCEKSANNSRTVLIVAITFLIFGILLLTLRFHFKSKTFSTLLDYRAVFHRLDRAVKGIEPPIVLWKDNAYLNIRRRGVTTRVRNHFPNHMLSLLLKNNQELTHMINEIKQTR